MAPHNRPNIDVEVWPPDTWNGKLFSRGGGGFSGGPGGISIDASLNKTMSQGYVAATSGPDHPTNSSAQRAYQRPERAIDFGHCANHLVAVAAKQVSNAYYRGPVQRAYFQGCSGGGREALMEVLRYPEDCDGVIANPMQCRFDPAVLQCRVFDTGACLTPTEMSVLRALYEGPRLPGAGL